MTPPRIAPIDSPISPDSLRLVATIAPAPHAGTAGHGSLGDTRARARWAAPAFTVAVAIAALWVLRAQLAGYEYPGIALAMRAMPLDRIVVAAAFTLLSYAILIAYDALSLAYVRQPMSRARTGFASFIAYGLSQTLGFPAFTGGAVRYRLWRGWGLSAPDAARAAAFAGVIFTIGVMLVTGASLVLEPAKVLRQLGMSAGPPRTAGALLLAAVGAFVLLSVVRGGTTMRVGRWSVPVPHARLALTQLVVAAGDWTAAALVLYALLALPVPHDPASAGLGFFAFTGAFIIAQTAGQLSHVPGGLGVFDALMVVLLRPFLPPDRIFGALIVYRAIYYLAPFVLALVMLSAHQLWTRTRLAALADRAQAATMTSLRIAHRAGLAMLPAILSVATFAAGTVLLISGATPGIRHRQTWLAESLPLPIMEMSHLIGSLVGVGLLVLAWAIRRRIDAAFGLTIVMLGIGIVASMLKGLDFEEALVLAAVLAAVLPARRVFYRRSALLAEPFTAGWILAVIAVTVGVAWIGMLSYQHVDYAGSLWWRFRPHADAARFLRATVLSSGALVAFGLLRLLRGARAAPALPGPEELRKARVAAAAAHDTVGHLSQLGDKALLFSDSGRSFIQYGVRGRSWVVMGDPVVPPDAAEERAEIAWRFRGAADRSGGWPVFYEVSAEHLPLYIDLGLTLRKVGEEARVPLDTFSLEGGGRKGLRRVLKDVERSGATFEVVPASDVPPLLPELEVISDEWLAQKRVREKHFSLGRFDEPYLRGLPVAIVRGPAAGAGSRGPVVAFANLWPGGGRHELSVDLMRFTAAAPRGVMDYLFIRLMLWGQAEGYRWFNLGMAPLAGFEPRPHASVWTRTGAWLFRHGEHFYNFQGLRQYKEKYDPVWTPRYLASPAGLALPRIIADVASLIAGGARGLVAK